MVERSGDGRGTLAAFAGAFAGVFAAVCPAAFPAACAAAFPAASGGPSRRCAEETNLHLRPEIAHRGQERQEPNGPEPGRGFGGRGANLGID